MGVFKRYITSKDGTRTAYWYIRYSTDGKERWESVGKVGEVTKTVAQLRLEDVKKKIRRGVYGYEDATIRELEQDYIERITEIKKLRSWKQRIRHLRDFESFFGGKKLSQITSKDVDDYKLSQLKTLKPASVNRALATLRHLFNLAKRWKRFYGENPVSVSGLLTEDNQRDRILSFDEEGRLLSSSANHLKPIIITALNTGMRKSEILTLKWTDVDLDNNLIIINPSNNKSKRLKRIPVNSTLSSVLRELKLKSQIKSEYVFLGDDEKPIKDIKTAYLNACRRAGIQGLRFHDLRHTAGTRMVESGVGIVAINKILGHSSVEITMKRYLHPEDSLREAVEKLADYNNNRSNSSSNEKIVLS